MDLHDTGATFMPLEAGHRLGPRNSTRFDEGTVENPSKIETPSDEGKEQRASDRFCGNVQEITNLELAERVGVLAHAFAKANEFTWLRFRINVRRHGQCKCTHEPSGRVSECCP